MRICEASGENQARPNSRAPTSPLPLLFCGEFHGQKINKSGLNRGARNSLTPGFFRNYRNNKNRTFGCCSFFSPPQWRNPKNPIWSLLSHMSMLRCLHSALRGQTSSFASKKELPYFSQTQRERDREEKRGGEMEMGDMLSSADFL